MLDRHSLETVEQLASGTALGREGALRVTYGTPRENDRFLAAMGEILG